MHTGMNAEGTRAAPPGRPVGHSGRGRGIADIGATDVPLRSKQGA